MSLETLEKAILILGVVATLVAGLARALKFLTVRGMIRCMVAAVLVCGLVVVAGVVLDSLQRKGGEKEKEPGGGRDVGKPKPEPVASGGQVDGKGLVEEIDNRAKSGQETKGALEQALDRHAFKCIRAEVVDKPKVIESNDAKATIRVQVRFLIDPKAYDEFSSSLVQLLKPIAQRKGGFNLLCKRDKQDSLDPIFTPSSANTAFQGFNGALPQPLTTRSVAVCTSRSKLNDRSEWTYYTLDDAARGVLAKYSAHVPGARLSLLDKGGRTVLSDRFPVQADGSFVEKYVGNPVCLPRCAGLFLVAPFFFERLAPAPISYKAALTFSRDITLSLDELRGVQKYQCEVEAD